MYKLFFLKFCIQIVVIDVFCVSHVFVSFASNPGPVLTAVWPKAPPLTAHCLSPLLGFESRPGHVGKLPVTWKLGNGLCREFPLLITIG